MQNILVTGGLGYIGSHTVVALHEAGFNPVILDNNSNSSPEFLQRIAKIIGQTPTHYNFDVCDKTALNNLFANENISGVIHFAAFKAVGDSVNNPLSYYRNNVDGLLSLLESMEANKNTPTEKAQSPYAHTKQIGEDILNAATVANSQLKVIALRYFNPTGAHASAIIGEAPLGVPSNLIPFLTQTAAGIRKQLTIYGHDYDTPDGTCIRDYIHVTDLANAHVIAIKRMLEDKNLNAYELFNLGTGKGSSVLECVNTFEEVTGVKVNYTIGERRAGDVVKVWADTRKANEVLGWKSECDLKMMLKSAWDWQCALLNNKS